jgi:hypothetical protein
MKSYLKFLDLIRPASVDRQTWLIQLRAEEQQLAARGHYSNKNKTGMDRFQDCCKA